MAKRFTWRLDSVRKARERHEDLKKQALGEAQGAQNIEEGKLSDLQNHKQGQTDRLRSNQSGKLNPRDLQAAHEYISDLDKKIAEQKFKHMKQLQDRDSQHAAKLQSCRAYRQTDDFFYPGQMITFWTPQSPELITGWF